MVRKLVAGALALAVALCTSSGANAANLSTVDANKVTQYLCEKTLSDGSLAGCHVVLDGTTLLPISPATAAGQAAEITALSGMATAAGQASMLSALQSLLQPGGKVDTVINTPGTDIGASVGTSAVTLAPANASRRFLKLQIQTPGSVCYFTGLGTATQDNHSLMLVAPSAASGGAGVYFTSDPQDVGTGAISMICNQTTLVYGRQG